MSEDAIYCTYDTKIVVANHPEDAFGAAVSIKAEKPVYAVDPDGEETDRQIDTKMEQVDLTISETLLLIEMLAANVRQVVEEAIG